MASEHSDLDSSVNHSDSAHVSSTFYPLPLTDEHAPQLLSNHSTDTETVVRSRHRGRGAYELRGQKRRQNRGFLYSWSDEEAEAGLPSAGEAHSDAPLTFSRFAPLSHLDPEERTERLKWDVLAHKEPSKPKFTNLPANFLNGDTVEDPRTSEKVRRRAMRRRRRQVKRMLASRRKARFEKHYGEGKSLTEEIPGEDPVSLSAYELTEGEVSTMDSEAYMLIEEDIVLEEGEQPQPLEKKPQVAEAEIAFADEEITSFERFVQLGKNGRSLMRHAPRQFIREVERLLLDFALDEMDSCTVCEHEDCTIKALTDTQLTIQLADSYLRRIVHELCTYHALKSESITSQSGHRVITVRRSARAQYNHKITVDFCLS